jgi:hypothetical protein
MPLFQLTKSFVPSVKAAVENKSAKSSVGPRAGAVTQEDFSWLYPRVPVWPKYSNLTFVKLHRVRLFWDDA